MSLNYAKPLPRDKGNDTMQNYAAPYVALARQNSQNATASSVISFTDNTTAIEVTAINGTAALKWIASSDTQASVIGSGATANYDHVIPINTMRRFVIPQETQGTASIVGANVQNGLYRRVAFITNGAASVLTSEF